MDEWRKLREWAVRGAEGTEGGVDQDWHEGYKDAMDDLRQYIDDMFPNMLR